MNWAELINSLNLEDLAKNQYFVGMISAGLIGLVTVKGGAMLRWIWARIYRTFATSIELNSQNSRSYQSFVNWLFEQKSFKNLKTLSQVGKINNDDYYEIDNLPQERQKELKLSLSPADGFYFGRLGWRPVGLYCWSQTNQMNGAKTYYVQCITFGFSNKYFKNILANLADVDKDFVFIYQGARRHSFTKKGKRDFSTIYLQNEMVDEINKDLERFFKNRQKYRDKGIPWKRNYLFEGPPGTGKSSLIFALASRYDKNIVMIGASSSDNDINCAYQCGQGDLLAFEDIDGMSITLSRAPDSEDEESKEVSLSTILNCLDGLNSSEGSVTIITTNDPSKLDPAILRAGRIDKRFKLDYFDFGFACEVYKKFTGTNNDGIANRDIREWFGEKEGKYIVPSLLQEKLYEKVFC